MSELSAQETAFLLIGVNARSEAAWDSLHDRGLTAYGQQKGGVWVKREASHKGRRWVKGKDATTFPQNPSPGQNHDPPQG